MGRYDGVCHEILTPEEEARLADRITAGDEDAKLEMAEKNLRLVMFLAKKFEKGGSGQFTYGELVSEGMIGLKKAVDHFDRHKGAKFSSYASWWIKQAIRRKIIESDTPMRIPAKAARLRMGMRKAIAEFKEEHGFPPSLKELGGMFPEHSMNSIKAVHEIISVVSMDMPLTDGEANSVGDVLADERCEMPDSRILRVGITELIEDALPCLSERSQLIIILRFGLNGGPPMTLEAVSRIIGLTRERVRQIQRSSLKKMRSKIERDEAEALEEANRNAE